jgi:toxin ParE1/3/4
MPRTKIRPLAWQDISQTAEYLESQSGFELADRFLNAVMADLESISKMPKMGALCGFQNHEARDVRRWSVTGFERWLIFYNTLASGIDVARVLHGAQDINTILD